MHGTYGITPDLLRRVNECREAISSAQSRSLHQTVFFNRLSVAPRRLNEISQEETEAFLGFLETLDETAVRERGRQLALEGLGRRSILAMTEALRRVYWEITMDGAEATGSYVCVLLEGYMDGREEYLLQEQERTWEAFLRARDRQRKDHSW